VFETRVPHGFEGWCREGELNPQGPEPSNGIFPCHLRDDQISVGSVGSGSRTGASGFFGESGGSLMGGGKGSAGSLRRLSNLQRYPVLKREDTSLAQ
jgi:hypothetical protein